MSSPSVDAWIDALPKNQKRILECIRKLILATCPNAIEEIKWSRPCYSNDHGLFCYLQTTMKHATLGFQHGVSLDDPKKILEGTGKEMRHIKIKAFDGMDISAYKALLKLADSI